MRRIVVLAALVLAGCTSAPPRLLPPDRVESFCATKEPRGGAVMSILSSVADRLETSEAWPGDDVLRTDVEQNGGVIGHWKSQPLYMPFAAKTLGVDGNYIDVTDVVIDNLLSGNVSRLIYVTIAGAHGPKNIILRAFDTQNICVPGEKLE